MLDPQRRQEISSLIGRLWSRMSMQNCPADIELCYHALEDLLRHAKEQEARGDRLADELALERGRRANAEHSHEYRPPDPSPVE